MEKNKLLEVALNVIDDNIECSHNEIVQKILEKTGCCENSFSNFFYRLTDGNLKLKNYIIYRRIYLAARELVESPETPIVDIALKYGYSDQTSFTRAIRGVYKTTPKTIREKKIMFDDNRLISEIYIGNRNRLDASISSLTEEECEFRIDDDLEYIETYIKASENYGFDYSTCSLISELSEKLEVSFGELIHQCFTLTLMNQMNGVLTGREEKAFELGIDNSEELTEICRYYNCEYYELNHVLVERYQKKFKKV